MEINTRNKQYKGYDVTLIILYFVLVFIGWLSIYSASYDPLKSNFIFDFSTHHGRQLIWIGTSLLIIILIFFSDSKYYQLYAYYFYGICLLLLISVLFLGTEISGAKAWIKIGQFSIQPSEFMKMAVALAIAKLFADGKTNLQRQYSWLIVAGMIIVPVIIIFLQKDTGSALVYLSFSILLYREGLSGKLFVFGFLIILLCVITLYFNELYAIAAIVSGYIAFFIVKPKQKKNIIRNVVVMVIAIIAVFAINITYEHVFQLHQKQRIDSLLGKTADPQGVDFNLNQSKIAIGSGGFFGKGYLRGTQTKFNFVPEQSTDFIFCGIGEEWGFFGSLILIVLFLWLVLRIIFTAEQHRKPFVRYYGYGIAGIIFFHFAINLGMTMGLLPIIGIPLPFISYGGSSLWAFTAMLFVYIKINT